MTEIYLVRHPESAMNIQPDLVGGQSAHADITPRGAEQARRFARAFQQHYPTPDVLYSSTAVRTQALMKIYKQETGNRSDVMLDANLLEMSHGPHEGKLRSEIYTPEVLALIKEQQLDFALPGGESVNTAADRMYTWLYDVAEKHPDSVILASTHGQIIRAALGRALGWSQFKTTIDPDNRTGNVDLAHVSLHDRQVTVHFWNRTIIEPVEKAESELY